MLEKLRTFFNHERYQVIALAVGIALVFWFVGCESEVSSMLSPGKKVNRTELQAELNLYLATAERKFKSLEQQEAIKKWVFENAILVSETGTLNPQGLINTLFAVMGIGALTDNVRKRKVINTELKRYVSEAKPKTDEA